MMTNQLPIDPEMGVAFPVMEFRITRGPDGKRRVVHQKWFQAMFLRDLAHDIMERAPDADREKNEEDYSDLVAVVLLLVASLEAFLNDMLIAHSRSHYGKDYKSIAEGLLGGSIRSRVLRIVPVVSGSRKRLNHGSSTVGALFELIKARNELAHTVDYYQDNPPEDSEADRPKGKQISGDACAKYMTALSEFYAAVLSGTHVLKGRVAWDHPLILDAEADHDTAAKDAEQGVGNKQNE